MMKHPLVVVALLGASIGLFQGCGPSDPYDAPFPPKEDALGKDTDPVPAGAEVIDVAEFGKYWQARSLWTFTDRAQTPYPGVNQAEPIAVRPKLSFRGFDGQDHLVELLAADETAALQEQAVATFPDFENQLSLYHHLTGKDDLTEARKLSISQLIQTNSVIAAQGKARIATAAAPSVGAALPNALQGPSCDGDVGHGNLSDRSGTAGACDRHSLLGVYGHYDFPIRTHVSCVKDQSNRGTCGAFAIVAGMESEISRLFGQKVNLSEQDLYSHIKGYWWPSRYGDGINADSTTLKMIEKNYVVPYESVWGYNPSHYRTENDKTALYTHSCDSYSESCSDTVHQGRLVCAKTGGLLYCGYATPINTSGAGYQVTSQSEMWNGNDTTSSLNTMVSLLGNGKPVLIGINVPPSFDGASWDGYVTYNANDGASRGGHLIEAVGSITNTQLHAILPTAPAGSGGGYIIAKNSWGLCYADGGFVYLPYDWIKTQVWSATVLDSIESAK